MKEPEKSFADWVAERKAKGQSLAELTPEENTERYGAPTHIVRKWPEAKDNKGRVSDGVARDLQKRAEAAHAGTQAEAIATMTTMVGHVDQNKSERNARKRQRRARRA